VVRTAADATTTTTDCNRVFMVSFTLLGRHTRFPDSRRECGSAFAYPVPSGVMRSPLHGAILHTVVLAIRSEAIRARTAQWPTCAPKRVNSHTKSNHHRG
jgi:hypothetical protein